MIDNFDLKKYLAENKLLKEEFAKPQEDSDLETLKSRYNPTTPEDLRDLEAIAQKQDPKLWMLGTPEFDSTQIQLGDYIKFPVESKPTLVWYADDKKVKADYDSYEYSTFNRSLLNKMNREQSQDTSLNEEEVDSEGNAIGRQSYDLLDEYLPKMTANQRFKLYQTIQNFVTKEKDKY
jgi:hypothetical protein